MEDKYLTLTSLQRGPFQHNLGLSEISYNRSELLKIKGCARFLSIWRGQVRSLVFIYLNFKIQTTEFLWNGYGLQWVYY